MSGFQPSDLILVAARPSMGKTAFVLNIAQSLNEIRSELFPAIKNPEINILYKDDQKKDVSLVKFFSETDGQDDLHTGAC